MATVPLDIAQQVLFQAAAAAATSSSSTTTTATQDTNTINQNEDEDESNTGAMPSTIVLIVPTGPGADHFETKEDERE